MKNRTWIILSIFSIIIAACDTNTYSEIEQDLNTNTSTNQNNTTTNSGSTTGSGTSGTGTNTTTKVTYTNDIKAIMTTNCTSCHNSSMQSPSLTTYTQVKNATSNGKLLCTIQANGCKTMPPTGKMSKANIDLILLWKSQGYIQ